MLGDRLAGVVPVEERDGTGFIFAFLGGKGSLQVAWKSLEELGGREICGVYVECERTYCIHDVANAMEFFSET